MAIRYQPKGTTADMMRLGAKAGQAQARAARAQEESRYARQRSDELRKVRRDAMMRDYDDQTKLKAQQAARDWDLQKMQMTSQRQYEMQMMRQEALEGTKIKTEVDKYSKYLQAKSKIEELVEGEDIEKGQKAKLLLRTDLKYYGYDSVLAKEQKESEIDRMIREQQEGQDVPNDRQPSPQQGEIKVMKKSTNEIGYLPANELTDEYVRMP